jgi:iron-sulfur cluster insertion protein
MKENNFSISLSDSASRRINFLTSSGEDSGKLMRLSVDGGGCSGFKYVYSFDLAANDDDIIINHLGSCLLIDPTSAELLKNSIIDYVETLGSAGFEVKNPNASSKCGCGSSFSI